DCLFLVFQFQRALREQETRAVEQFDQRFRALFQARHDREDEFANFLEARREDGAIGQFGEEFFERIDQKFVGAVADIEAVQVFELRKIETRGGAADTIKIEQRNQL